MLLTSPVHTGTYRSVLRLLCLRTTRDRQGVMYFILHYLSLADKSTLPPKIISLQNNCRFINPLYYHCIKCQYVQRILFLHKHKSSNKMLIYKSSNSAIVLSSVQNVLENCYVNTQSVNTLSSNECFQITPLSLLFCSSSFHGLFSFHSPTVS